MKLRRNVVTALLTAVLVCVPTLLPEGVKIAAATGLILSLQGRLKEFQKGGHRCEG